MKVALDWQMVVVSGLLVAGAVAAFALKQQEVGYALAGIVLGLFGRQPVALEEKAEK